MSELRQDPLTGRWVILAAGRGDRPDEFGMRPRLVDDPATRARCPFCPGREDQTTPEILALGRTADAPANGPGWNLRVVRNMFPAVHPAHEATDPAPAAAWSVRASAVGAHEVLIYSPDHAAAPADLTAADWSVVLGILAGRLEEITAMEGVRYVSPFCNHGPDAGATLTHPHMQIIATGVVPDQAVDRAVRWDDHRQATGRCLLCDMRCDELEDRSRLVASNEAGIVTAAVAGRYPFEMLLIPARHAPVLDRGAAGDFTGLGELLAQALGALRRLKGDCSLNLVFHGAPRVDPGGRDRDPRLAALVHDPAAVFHWHLEIIPRLSRSAGFEIGTGFTINAVLPEEAARLLRTEGADS